MIESATEFIHLRLSEDPEEYLRAAREEAPEQVWREVVERYPAMRIWVARNKTVPLTILRILSDDADTAVRGAVAWRRKLDEDLFEKLARDSDYGVRGEIARNKKTPFHVLRSLVEDRNEWVRSIAIQKVAERDPKTPQSESRDSEGHPC